MQSRNYFIVANMAMHVRPVGEFISEICVRPKMEKI
jgi:hypothetical protein